VLTTVDGWWSGFEHHLNRDLRVANVWPRVDTPTLNTAAHA
jgi:hypothetical protein